MRARAAVSDDGSLSVQDWALLPTDTRGELVDGRIEEEEVADNVHESILSWLNALLRAWIIPSGGFVLGSEAKYALGRRQGRKPDLGVYLPGGPPPPRRGVNRRPPDIAIEVISPTPRDARRDRVDKVREYAAFGVRWYWLVDPELRTLEILERDARGRFAHALDATTGTVRRVPGCDGLVLDLDALWAEVDRLGPLDPPARRARR